MIDVFEQDIYISLFIELSLTTEHVGPNLEKFQARIFIYVNTVTNKRPRIYEKGFFFRRFSTTNTY